MARSGPPIRQNGTGKKRTTLMIQEEKRKILEYIAEGKTDIAIMQALNIPKRMLERRIKTIEQEHLKQILDSQTAQAKASILVQCMERMKWLEMKAKEIAEDESARHFDRLLAMDRVRQFKLDQAKLISEGPTVFRIVVNGTGLYRGNEAERIESADTPELSEAAIESISTRNNDERQF